MVVDQFEGDADFSTTGKAQTPDLDLHSIGRLGKQVKVRSGLPSWMKSSSLKSGRRDSMMRASLALLSDKVLEDRTADIVAGITALDMAEDMMTRIQIDLRIISNILSHIFKVLRTVESLSE